MTRDEWNAALIARHGASLHEKFSNATVAVCGLGGLGSNIAISLARAGVGKLILIDFDRVDISNLNRQQYKAAQIGMPKTEALRDNLLAIAPFLQTQVHTVRMMEENAARLVREADVVCEAFDDAQAKAMLVNCVCEELPKTYLVAASGMAGLASPNVIKTRRIGQRFYLCGDGVSDVKSGLGLVAPRVMLCASHQALTVLRILAGEYEV